MKQSYTGDGGAGKIGLTQHVVYDIIRRFAGQANVLTIPVLMIDICGDHTTALLLSQILYWWERAESKERGFAKSAKEWHDELRLSQYQVSRALKILTAAGVSTELKKWNGAPTLFYRVDEDQFSKWIFKFLENRETHDSIYEDVQNPKSSDSEMDYEETHKSIYKARPRSETTSETPAYISSETTSETRDPAPVPVPDARVVVDENKGVGVGNAAPDAALPPSQARKARQAAPPLGDSSSLILRLEELGVSEEIAEGLIRLDAGDGHLAEALDSARTRQAIRIAHSAKKYIEGIIANKRRAAEEQEAISKVVRAPRSAPAAPSAAPKPAPPVQAKKSAAPDHAAAYAALSEAERSALDEAAWARAMADAPAPISARLEAAAKSQEPPSHMVRDLLLMARNALLAEREAAEAARQRQIDLDFG